MLAQIDVSSFTDGVSQGLRNAWASVIEFAPKLIGALLILFIGWFVAKVIKTVFENVLTRLGLDRMLDRAGLTGALQKAGYTASSLVARIIYWMALLVVLLMAAEVLNVASLTVLLAALLAYLPLVAIAIIIVVVAAAIGSFVADVSAPWAEAQGVAWVSKAARWTFIVVGAFAALNTLGVAADIVNTLFIAVVASTGVAMAIAFGVGGIKPAEDYWRKILPNNDSNN